MAVYQCKMCGGNVEIEEGSNIAVCEYCGSRQTVPTVDNEKKITLFGRANRLRMASEFDKAYGVYESIVSEFPEEAEAYWGLVLCKYGIEYVDDPATGKKIPTCHRSSFDSVMEDSDFEQACENTDAVARKVYREEAKQIEELRRGIVEVSGKEEPYDIFICYKETDDKGDRTLDSVLAQDIYDVLTEKGYRVFFSRITLEDKLGQEYEPYIFAALHSAKVMLAVGTDYEYYNAVWVKNEWSRYLKLMEQDKEKHLIPCFKNLDAYDMPKEFARLQAQDMGKVGATQDLLRGIEKLIGKKQQDLQIPVAQPVAQPVAIKAEAPGVESLLERGNLFLEDEDFTSADEYFDKVLDIDPECARAYLGKVLAENELNTMDELYSVILSLKDDKNYQKAYRFADASLKKELDRILQDGKKYAEEQRKIQEEKRRIAEQKRAEEERIAEQKRKERMVEIAPAQSCISTGYSHTVGLRSDGTVVATKYTGKYYFGECEVSSWTDIVAISARNHHTVGLRADGTVVATKYTGENYDGQCDVSSWKNIVAISAGEHHTVGLHSDGTVVATKYTGENYDGQCDVSSWKNIVAISAGEHHTVGLRADGTVVATRYTGYQKYYRGQCDVFSWKNIVAISAGDEFTVGLRSDGTVVATRKNGADQCDVSDWTDIVAISAGPYYAVGLRADGTVVTMKSHFHGQSNWEDIVAISAGGGYIIGLRSDGTVVATKYTGDQKYYSGQCDVQGWKLFNSLTTLGKEREETAKLHAERRANGLCPYCGGTFKGLFTKKCSSCGRPKDY